MPFRQGGGDDGVVTAANHSAALPRRRTGVSEWRKSWLPGKPNTSVQRTCVARTARSSGKLNKVRDGSTSSAYSFGARLQPRRKHRPPDVWPRTLRGAGWAPRPPPPQPPRHAATRAGARAPTSTASSPAPPPAGVVPQEHLAQGLRKQQGVPRTAPGPARSPSAPSGPPRDPRRPAPSLSSGAAARCCANTKTASLGPRAARPALICAFPQSTSRSISPTRAPSPSFRRDLVPAAARQWALPRAQNRSPRSRRLRVPMIIFRRVPASPGHPAHLRA